jgi:hypothetical protein
MGPLVSQLAHLLPMAVPARPRTMRTYLCSPPPCLPMVELTAALCMRPNRGARQRPPVLVLAACTHSRLRWCSPRSRVWSQAGARGCTCRSENKAELCGIGARTRAMLVLVARMRQSSAALGQSTHGSDTTWRDEQVRPFCGDELPLDSLECSIWDVLDSTCAPRNTYKNEFIPHPISSLEPNTIP